MIMNVIFHERLHDGQDLRKLDLRTDIERIGEVPLENKVVRCVGQRLDHHKTHLVRGGRCLLFLNDAMFSNS